MGRSAYLVMLTGASFLAVICKIMVNQVDGVFGYDRKAHVAKTVSGGRKKRQDLLMNECLAPHAFDKSIQNSCRDGDKRGCQTLLTCSSVFVPPLPLAYV